LRLARIQFISPIPIQCSSEPDPASQSANRGSGRGGPVSAFEHGLSDYLRLADAPPKTRLRLPLLPLPDSFQVADSWIPLEFQIKPNGGHKHRTAVAIVSGVSDMLQAWSNVNAAPDVCGVIGLQDIFAALVEPTIAYDEAVASIGKVGLVVKRDTVVTTNY